MWGGSSGRPLLKVEQRGRKTGPKSEGGGRPAMLQDSPPGQIRLRTFAQIRLLEAESG